MDKYLYLARQMLYESFTYVSRAEFDKETCTELVEILSRTPLNISDKQIPNGIRYHVLDILADELNRLWSSMEIARDLHDFAWFINLLLEPVRQLKSSTVKPMSKRAAEVLEDQDLRELMHLELEKDERGKNHTEDPGGEPQLAGPVNDADDDDWAGFDD